MSRMKGSSIMLFKECRTQADSRGLSVSVSKQKLKENLRHLNNRQPASRLKPNDYSLNNKPCLKACNMQDSQNRIKRQYSPLYQRSSQEKQLFEKGLKKSQTNINLTSKINLCSKLQTQPQFDHTQTLSPRVIKRSDPNKQAQNIFELGSKPPLSNRSVKKKDPNAQSSYKEARKQRSLLKDKNAESSQTADYVIKTLATQPCAQVKEIHIKFTKKQNIVNAQNMNNQTSTHGQQIVKQHKRHFSHVTLQANKQNIERRQNGICLKEEYTEKKKHDRKEFNHDFYKKQSRTVLKEKDCNYKTPRNYGGHPTSRDCLKTQHHEPNHHTSRLGQLRKRFL